MANRRFIDFPIASTVGDSDIILIWQSGANKQTTKATFLSGLPENLEDLNDVVISGLTNGQILRYDSVTGKWENTDQGNLDLNDLNDVSIVSPSNGQVLVYNSSTSKWENSSGGYVPYTGAVTTVNLGAQTIQAGQFVKAGGTAAQFLKADGSVDSTAYGTGSVTSVALTMPSAFNVANSPITTAGTLAVTGAGTVGQYIRGDGSLADFPQASGGGSSVNYYLNGSISQGTIGGVAYKELNKVPILGAGTDFTINADGYIASFLTDAGDPNLLEIPGGNWNFETYFSASSSGGTPTFYVELYKYDGTTFTLIASSSTSPELIAFGTNLNPYFSTLAVPTTTLALTDRLAVRFYVTHSGRTITLHTENNHLCQVVTTFTTGLTSLNGLTAQVQNLAVGSSGTDFNIASATATHTFNLPTASATNRGALSSADWTTFNNKQNALTNPVTGTGTTNYLPKFTGSTTIGNSNLINDASGNLGLGVTPSAWSLGTALDVANGPAILGFVNETYLINNAYFNSGFKYKQTSFASMYVQNSTGEHRFFTAPSGTSGNAISFTQAMTLFSTGNLLVGSPSPISDNGARLQVSGTATVSGQITGPSGAVTESKFNFIGYNNAYGGISANTGFNTSYNSVSIYSNFNSARSGQGNTSNPSWILDLGGSTPDQDSFSIFRSPAGSFSFSNLFKLSSTGAATFSSTVTAATLTTIGTAVAGQNVQLNLNGVSGKAQRIEFQNSGVQQWLIGAGAASETTAFEIFNSTGVISLSINKSTNAATFSGNVNSSGNFASNAANTSTAPQYYLTQTGGNTYSSIGINRADGTGIAAGIGSALVIRSGDATDFPIQFATANNVRVTIATSGNVLIGTTTDVGAKLAVNGVISSLGNAILSNSGNLTMTGTYQTIFTAGTDSAYFLTVQTNAIDGTFAIFALYNENSTERATSTILGNNIQVQFSGNDVQIRSVNGASYTVTYGTIRIK